MMLCVLRLSLFLLFLVVGMLWIIHRVMQSSTFFPLNGLPCYQIAHVYHVTQLADILRRRNSLKEPFRLFV